MAASNEEVRELTARLAQKAGQARGRRYSCRNKKKRKDLKEISVKQVPYVGSLDGITELLLSASGTN